MHLKPQVKGALNHGITERGERGMLGHIYRLLFKKCKYCGTVSRLDDSKYCEECGGEYGTNYDCGYRKKPHNCGQLQCPRYRLFLRDVTRFQSVGAKDHRNKTAR